MNGCSAVFLAGFGSAQELARHRNLLMFALSLTFRHSFPYALRCGGREGKHRNPGCRRNHLRSPHGRRSETLAKDYVCGFRFNPAGANAVGANQSRVRNLALKKARLERTSKQPRVNLLMTKGNHNSAK